VGCDAAAVTCDCTVVGEALVDLVSDPRGPGRFTAHPGGGPYNVAITLARLGVPTRLVARAGADEFGRMLAGKALRSGVGLEFWQTVREPTTLAVAALDADGRAQYDFYLDGTAAFGWTDSLVDLAPASGVLHVGSLASWLPASTHHILSLQQRVHAADQVLISYDPNVRPALMPSDARDRVERSVAAAHLVKASDEDLACLYPGQPVAAVAQRWLELGAVLVVVTHGAAGAMWFAAGREVARRAGRPTAVADTVGAGDSFAGGLLAALIECGLATPQALRAAVGTPGAALDEARVEALDEALAGAVLVSAMTCERPGAEPPTRAELQARLAR
jgi:fructokinase